jgi:hypothetical protein
MKTTTPMSSIGHLWHPKSKTLNGGLLCWVVVKSFPMQGYGGYGHMGICSCCRFSSNDSSHLENNTQATTLPFHFCNYKRLHLASLQLQAAKVRLWTGNTKCSLSLTTKVIKTTKLYYIIEKRKIRTRFGIDLTSSMEWIWFTNQCEWASGTGGVLKSY